MADIVSFKEDKKELIKENLKIKNQLQIVNSEYENIKRIYNNLLEEYLDLQFEENFDKVMIIQDEVGALKNNNYKLSEEIRGLREELSHLKVREKNGNYGQISSLKEENEILKAELNEKEIKLNNLNLEIETLKEQQNSITDLMKEISLKKEGLFNENLSIKKEIEEIKVALLNAEIELEKSTQIIEANKGKDLKVSELNIFINELQTEFEKIENEKNESIQKEKNLNLQISLMSEKNKKQEEKYQILEEDFEKTLESFEVTQNRLKIVIEKNEGLEKSREENHAYLEILQQDLEKTINSLNESKKLENKLNNEISTLKKIKEESDEFTNEMHLEIEKTLEDLKNSKKTNEELKNKLSETEKTQKTVFENMTELNEKIRSLENEAKEKDNQLNQLQMIIETLKIDAEIKGKTDIKNMEKKSIESKEIIYSFIPVAPKEHRVNIRNVFGKDDIVEEQADILGSIINSLEKRREFHPHKTVDSEKQEKIGQVISTEESILLVEEKHVDFNQVPLDENIISPEEGLVFNLKEIYSFENKTTEENICSDGNSDLEMEENYLKEKFEGLFNDEDLVEAAEIDEEINEEQEEKLFIKNNELFSKEKMEEFTDFLKFMLPRTIEDDIPLLEKDILYFMVSFAFYYYNGEDFWDLLLDKLEINLSEKAKYKVYLRKELDTVFKMHNFYQLKDEKGTRVGASIIMHSILPAKQMREYLNFVKNIYNFELKGSFDKTLFSEILLSKLHENKGYTNVKSMVYLEKSDNLEKLIDYSYEVLKGIDLKSKGTAGVNENLNLEVNEKIKILFEKTEETKKNRFSFENFYNFGKK